MSLSRYYRVLGLTEDASDQEVRRRYRTLVMKYHPDKNPSNEAADKFIRLTEAYDIIIGRKKAPSTTKENRSKGKSHEDRVKEAKKRYRDQKLKEQQENERYYQSLIKGRKWNMVKLFSVVGLVFSILLILDHFLPAHFEEDKVAYYSRDVYSGTGNKHISLIQTEKGNDLWIEGLNFTLYGTYPDIYIERSRIFHDPINVISIGKIEHTYYPAHYTFYSVSFAAILIFLIPLFTRYYKRRTIFFTVLWHLSLYLTGSAMLIFLFTNDHWAHLLTFGFL